MDSAEAQATGGDSFVPDISGDGRFVAFESNATNLVVGDSNGLYDVFVRDRSLGTTERVSVDSAEAQATGIIGSYAPAISADGRFVAFGSVATNLVAGDSNGQSDVFVRDRSLGTTERVSVDSGGAQAGLDSFFPAISGDGRFVAFESNATNLVPADSNNGLTDIFVRDRSLGTTERVSVDSAEAQATGIVGSARPAVSADGRFVAFYSSATNLVGGDSNALPDVFVRDRTLGTTERVSVDSGGAQAGGDSDAPAISADGRFVAFHSSATNLVAGDSNGLYDVFVRDRSLGATERVSVDSSAAQATGGTSAYPSISADGRFVAFNSSATNLVADDCNLVTDVFVRDRSLGTTERVSVDSGGARPPLGGREIGDGSDISGDGLFVAFHSSATNLVAGDSNGLSDVFVRDQWSGSACGAPLPHRKIVFVQGIHSESSCPAGAGFADRVGWMRDVLNTDSRIAAQVGTLSFHYFDYSSAPSDCSPYPQYLGADTCGRGAGGFDQYRIRLKEKIEALTADGTQVTVLAHSMGGLLAAYLVGIEPGWAEQKIASVVTYDSMPEGFDSPPVAQFVYQFSGDCTWWPGPEDPSIAAMWKSSGQAITSKAREACLRVPFYTIDATGGLDIVPANISQFSLGGSGCDYHLPSPETPHVGQLSLAWEHSNAWTDESPQKDSFIECAVLRCSWSAPQGLTIPPGISVNSPVPVLPHAAYGTAPNTLDINTMFPPGTIDLPSTCLISPSGTLYCPPGPGASSQRALGALVQGIPAYSSGDGWNAWHVSDPEAGQWTVRFLNTGSTDLNIQFSSSVGHTIGSDLDLDGVPDSFDMCPQAFDPFQTDTDGDSLGNACDSDDDADTVEDASDNCPLNPNATQTDADLDGLGDACDGDDDNDGMLDADEAVHACLVLGQNDAGLDPDGDTLVNLTELLIQTNPCANDSDGDGYLDAAEAESIGTIPTRPCGIDGWPSNTFDGGLSANRLDILDVTSFVAPNRRFDTSPGHPFFSPRWDLVPGPSGFPQWINILDITELVSGPSGNPPMFGGGRAFGKTCPYPP